MEPLSPPASDAVTTVEFRVAHPDCADEILVLIRKVPGVADAGLLKPGAKHPLVRSMAFAHLDGTVDTEIVRSMVAEIQGVEACEISAPRYLV
jgi:hypothetical protein